MKKPTPQERAEKHIADHDRMVADLSRDMWRHAFVEATLRLLRRRDDVSFETLQTELQELLSNQVRVPAGAGSDVRATREMLDRAIEKLLEARVAAEKDNSE